MRMVRHGFVCSTLLATMLLLSAACRKKEAAEQPDHPRLTPSVSLHDVTFRSAALNRDMQYRVVLPVSLAPGQRLPAVYLLHGGGGGFQDWTNESEVARFA